MTIQTVAPKHHISVKSAAIGLAGAGLAVGAAFGVTAALSGDGTTTAPGEAPRVVNTDGAWDSWDRRGNRNAVPGTEHGVRDSWMPPGTTDQGTARR